MLNERYSQILAHCRQPRTMKELAERFNVNYYTIRKDVKLLVEQDLIKELPFRLGAEKQYQTAFMGMKDKVGELAFKTQRGDRQVSELLDIFLSSVDNPTYTEMFARIGYALISLYYVDKVAKEEGRTLAPNKQQTKRFLEILKENFDNASNVIEQALVSPLFLEESDVTELIKVPESVDIATIHNNFEHLLLSERLL